MNAVASRLVASGLMEEPGRPRDSELHFHVAAVVLPEHSAPATELLEKLSELLSSMSARTHRPVRFIEDVASHDVDEDGGAEPEATRPAPA
jgi:hypothetical protein